MLAPSSPYKKSGAVFPVTSGILQKIKSLFIICRIMMICLPVLLYQKKISDDLKKRGCTFAGPVIIYSFLQAAGIIDDHLESCPFRSTNRT